MQLRRTLRRIKRFTYLGAITGTVIAVRRARRQSRTTVGPPATWPPLERSPDEPVAAVGDLARAADEVDARARPSDAPGAAPAATGDDYPPATTPDGPQEGP